MLECPECGESLEPIVSNVYHDSPTGLQFGGSVCSKCGTTLESR
ncbi:MAG: hypothetical protein SXQ77_13015 [Halobacteria archaeon]|nr:hypothetical protein [Halobacteria archaeon]